MSGTNDAKRELRRTMRAVRREAALDPSRSAAIVERLLAMPELAGAGTVLLYDAVAGEPDVAPVVDDLRQRGADVIVVEPRPDAVLPVVAADLDVVVVPGVAFALDGHRLGQGGGWYDRVLVAVRPDCLTVGVCFDEQILRCLPVEAHDVAVRRVVTPTSTLDVAPPAGGA